MYFVQALLPNLCDKEKLCAAVSLNERLVGCCAGPQLCLPVEWISFDV